MFKTILIGLLLFVKTQRYIEAANEAMLPALDLVRPLYPDKIWDDIRFVIRICWGFLWFVGCCFVFSVIVFGFFWMGWGARLMVP